MIIMKKIMKLIILNQTNYLNGEQKNMKITKEENTMKNGTKMNLKIMGMN